MDSSLPLKLNALTDTGEPSSLTRLLESGLLCLRQRHYDDGVAFLTLALERLSPNQIKIMAEIKAIVKIRSMYLRTEAELHQASKHFASAETEQQLQLAVLENLLSTFLEETEGLPSHVNDLRNTNRDDLSPLLQLSSRGFEVNQSPTTLEQRAVAENKGDQSLSPILCEANTAPPPLYVTCFGNFEVRQLGKPLVLCSSRSGQGILRYLVAQSRRCATTETLISLFWPEDDEATALSKLHSAISALRRFLNNGYRCEPGGGYILCKNRVYYLNPSVQIRTDVEEFLEYYQVAKQKNGEEAALYEKACHLYTGPFLPEDMYADWSFLQREHLKRIFISMCRVLTIHYMQATLLEDAAKWAAEILKVDHCDEEAHRQLIQIYAAQGRRSEAQQQYQRCKSILREELGMAPMPETTRAFQMLFSS